MLNNKKVTLDWLHFIEQLKERISRGDKRDFSYQLIIESRDGTKLTLSINVEVEDIKRGLTLVKDQEEKDENNPAEKKKIAKLSF